MEHTLLIKRSGTMETYRTVWNGDFVYLDTDCRNELSNAYPEITMFEATGEFLENEEEQTFEYVLTVNYNL